MSTRASLARTARQLHLYLGVFVAPALLFFAFTGALQTFSLHEKPWGGGSQPPHWVLVLARLHKDQTIVLPPPRAPRHAEGPAPASLAPGEAHPDQHPDRHPGAGSDGQQHAGSRSPMASRLPMKLFFLVVTLTLFSSVLTGLYMAFSYKRNKLALAGTLAAGVIVPLVLLLV